MKGALKIHVRLKRSVLRTANREVITSRKLKNMLREEGIKPSNIERVVSILFSSKNDVTLKLRMNCCT